MRQSAVLHYLAIKAAGTLRLDYAQFLELEVFTRFGGMPDGHVRDQLTRGARIRQALRQSQHMPFRLIDSVALMLAVQSGMLDALPLTAVTAFRTRLPEFLDEAIPQTLHRVAETSDLNDADRAELLAVLGNLAASLTDEPAEPDQG